MDKVRVRFRELVRVKGWIIHYTYESPHEDQSTRMCVLQSGGTKSRFSGWVGSPLTGVAL